MPDRDRSTSPERTGGSLGAGAEAAAGIHAQRGTEAPSSDRAENADHRSASAKGTDRAGSEPLGRDREHEGSYGGEGGAPRTSSDTREPHDPT